MPLYRLMGCQSRHGARASIDTSAAAEERARRAAENQLASPAPSCWRAWTQSSRTSPRPVSSRVPGKRRLTTALGNRLVNPLVRGAVVAGVSPPTYAVLETVGRRSGEPRRTPVGNGLDGDVFWIVAEHGRQAGYVRNVDADPRVRVHVGGRWRSGTARALPDDDPRERQRTIGRRFNAAVVRAMGTELLSVRIDLDPVPAATAARRRDRVLDGLVAGGAAAVLSGIPSTLHAVVTRSDPLEAAVAAGSLLLPREERRARLLVAAAPAHVALSLGWGAVLALGLPRYRTVLSGALAGLAIAALDLGVVGRRLPRIRALAVLPQVADHVAFGAVVGWTTARRRARRLA